MKNFMRYSVGATLVAAALTLPQSVNAQIRSNPLAYGAGSSHAQRVDRRAAIQSGVYIAPGVGVREVPKPVEAYEYSSWTPSTTENVAEPASMEQLQRDYEANQERAKNRHTTRPINVPTTLGMLKDKSNAQNANVAQRPAQPQYLQYGPNLDPVQTSQNANVRRPATGGSATLNWDGSTNRDPQNPSVQLYGAVQAPTHAVARPAILDAAVSPQDQTPLTTNDADFSAPDAAPQVPNVAPFPEVAEGGQETSNFAQDVVNELRNSAIPEEDAPTIDAPMIDESPAALEQNTATFVAPDVVNAPNAAAPAETSLAPAPVAPQPVAPQPVETPKTQAAPAPTQAVPAPTQAAPAPAAPATEPTYRTYPAPKNVTPYAPKQDYYLMQPYYAPQARPYPAGPRRAVPQSRGIPSQFTYQAQGACAPQATCQVDQAPSCGAGYGASCDTNCGTYGGYGSGTNLAYAATEGVRPGMIFGAEWFNWSTYSGVASAEIRNPDGTSKRRNLEINNSGLRGRLGFRSLAGWDLVGTFTLFNQSASDGFDATEFAPGARIVNPRTDASVALDSVSSTLKVDLQSIDIELGRWKQIGLWDFRLFGGVRWTGLDQDLVDSVSYALPASEALDAEIALLDSAALFDEDGATEFSAAVAEPASATTGFRTRSHLNAFGVRLGLETRIPLSYGLAIYGKGAGALAAGRVKSTFSGLNVGDVYVYKKTELSPSVDASLGLSWRANGLEVRTGYEFNGWYNAGYFGGKKTDFLSHGFVAGLGYNY